LRLSLSQHMSRIKRFILLYIHSVIGQKELTDYMTANAKSRAALAVE